MKTRQLIFTSLFAALTAIGGLITIPLPISQVGITLQSFFTLLAGIILGSRAGAFSQLVYLLIGAVGLPVFSGGKGGVQVLVGPTGGYLWGFVIAAYSIGQITERQKKRSFRGDLLAMLVGSLVIYLPGTLVLHWSTRMSVAKAFGVGVIPFIPGDLLKIVLVGVMAKELRKRMIFLPTRSIKN